MIFSVILKIVYWLVFIVSVPASTYLVNMQGFGSVTETFIFTLSLFLLLPVFWKFYPPWKHYKRIGLHGIISFSLVAILQIGISIQEHFSGLGRYAYHLGHVLGPYRFISQNEPMQIMLKKTLGILPFSTQYMIYMTEDVSRVFKIKSDLGNNDFKENICKSKTQYECFKNIFLATNQKAAFNNTSCILMNAIGVITIFSEKKKDDVKSSLESALNVLDLSQMIYKSLHNESRVENILPDFPLDALAKIPEEIKRKIDLINPVQDLSFRELIFGFELPQMETSFEKSTLGAYLLKKTENDIISKFDKEIIKKMKETKNNILQELNDKEKMKNLTEEEILAYKKRLISLVP